MKKLVLVLAMLMVLPAAAFGIQYDLMNDGSMDELTGQAGVSIAMDDIQLFINIERLAWIDCDGFDPATAPVGADCSGEGGAVGIQNFQIDVLEINAIANTTGGTGNGASGFQGASTTGNPNLGSTTCGNLDLNWDYSSTEPLGGCQIDDSYGGAGVGGTKGLDALEADDITFSALTIDATSELPVLTEQYQNNNDNDELYIGGVLIGLPTIEVYIPAMSLTPAFYNIEGSTAEAANDVDGDGDIFGDSADYGTIEMSGITFTVLSGWIEIAPH